MVPAACMTRSPRAVWMSTGCGGYWWPVRYRGPVTGRIVLAVDVTCWLRPAAHTSPGRIMCHTSRRGKDQHIGVPGWPWSIVVAFGDRAVVVDRAAGRGQVGAR